MTPARDALIAAREWIAGERAVFVKSCTVSGDLATMDPHDAKVLAEDFDPILAQLDAAIASAAWEKPDV